MQSKIDELIPYLQEIKLVISAKRTVAEPLAHLKEEMAGYDGKQPFTLKEEQKLSCAYVCMCMRSTIFSNGQQGTAESCESVERECFCEGATLDTKRQHQAPRGACKKMGYVGTTHLSALLRSALIGRAHSSALVNFGRAHYNSTARVWGKDGAIVPLLQNEIILVP